jgi:MoaD family protein
MLIEVRGYLSFGVVLGKRRVEIDDGSTVKTLLEKLSHDVAEAAPGRVFHSQAGLRQHMIVLVNGRHLTHLPDRLETQLMDGDKVAVFPPISGG